MQLNFGLMWKACIKSAAFQNLPKKKRVQQLTGDTVVHAYIQYFVNYNSLQYFGLFT